MTCKVQGQKQEQENSLIIRCRDVLGFATMDRNGGLWRNLIRENPKKVKRVLDDIESCQREGQTFGNVGGYAFTLYKRFK